MRNVARVRRRQRLRRFSLPNFRVKTARLRVYHNRLRVLTEGVSPVIQIERCRPTRRSPEGTSCEEPVGSDFDFDYDRGHRDD